MPLKPASLELPESERVDKFLIHMEDKPDYHQLVAHYSDCFSRHGATAQGVDWPKEADALTRHRVMLNIIREHDFPGCSLLDLGCGYGALKDTIDTLGLSLEYTGIDLSEPLLESARQRHPSLAFHQRDILQHPLDAQSVDYVLMNGVLTEKRDLSFEAMERFMQALLKAAYAACRKGIAFNVFRTQVDFEDPKLFYMPYDRLAAFLGAELSRNLVFRGDYGLWEYTVYVYREPSTF